LRRSSTASPATTAPPRRATSRLSPAACPTCGDNSARPPRVFVRLLIV
jgi:hypothetical protein